MIQATAARFIAMGLFLQTGAAASPTTQSVSDDEQGNSGLRRAFLESSIALENVHRLATAWQRMEERKNKLKKVAYTLRRITVHTDGAITELSIHNQSDAQLRIHLPTLFLYVRVIRYEDDKGNRWGFAEFEKFVSWDWRSEECFVTMQPNAKVAVQAVDTGSSAKLRLADPVQTSNKDIRPKQLKYADDRIDIILVKDGGQRAAFKHFHVLCQGTVPVEWPGIPLPKEAQTRVINTPQRPGP